MSSNKLNSEYVINNLLLIINNKLRDVLNEVGVDYNIDSADLIDKYCVTEGELFSITNPQGKRKKRKKRAVLDDGILCKAITAKNIRCSLRKSAGCDLCLKHKNNIKFGRIDDANNYTNKDNFIKTTKEIIKGVEYLVDNNNIVYSYSTDLSKTKVIGEKINGILQFIS